MTHHKGVFSYNDLAGTEEFLQELFSRDPESCYQTVLNLEPLHLYTTDQLLYLEYRYLVKPKGLLLPAMQDHNLEATIGKA